MFMVQEKIIKKSWRKIANEKISNEMYFGRNYERNQMDKMNRELEIRWLKRVVKSWKISDVERVDDLLRHRREVDPEQFSRQFNQDILPLLGKCGKIKNVDGMCNHLSWVVEQRMCEESSRYSVWT